MSQDNSKSSLREILRDEMVMKDEIIKILQTGPKTIPVIAETLGQSTEKVVLWIMGMRRYGMITEVGRPDVEGYFIYAIKNRETGEESC